MRDIFSEIATVGSGSLTTGDVWNCTVRAFDGTDYSSYASDTVTIQSYPPSIFLSNITYGEAGFFTTSNLSGWCSALSSSNVTYFWKWYKNGAVYSSGNESYTTAYAYQENRDRSASSGTFLAIAPAVNLTDGSWGTYARANGAANAMVYENYTLHPDHLNARTYWQVKDGLATVNLSIPAACWISPIQFKAVSYYGGTAGTRRGNWTCFNGTSWSTLRYNTGNTAPNLYEDAMWWNTTVGLYHTSQDMTYLANISSDLAVGDNLTFECTAYDGSVYTPALNSSTITIVNSPPNVSSLIISPSVANITTDLQCNATLGDLENTTLSAGWWWYRNGTLQLWGNSTGLTRDINSLVTTLGSKNLTIGDVWNCTVRAFDGRNYSSDATTSVEVRPVMYPVTFQVNSSVTTDNTSIITIMQGETIIAQGRGNFTVNLTQHSLYTILTQTNVSGADKTEARIEGLNITGPNIRIMEQIVTGYSGSLPENISNVSVIYVLNDTGLTFDHVTLTLPKRGMPVNKMGHCLSWSYTTFNCLSWEINRTSEYQFYKNTTYVIFNVTSFDGYGPLSEGIDIITTAINFSTEGTVEAQQLEVNVSVLNNGLNPTGNFTLELNISLYNGTYVLDQRLLQNITFIASNSTVVSSFNWTAKIGTYRFTAFAEVFNEIEETDESNNNLTVNYTTSSWQIQYGKYNYSLGLIVNSTFVMWSAANATGSSFYSDVDSAYNAPDLRPLNGTNYLSLADSALGMSYFSDSLRGLFDGDNDTWSDAFINMTIAGTSYRIPAINSTGSSNFITGIMYDSADGSPYDGTQDLVFVTLINPNHQGGYGAYDYEIRIPSQLGKLKGTTNLVQRIDEIN
jgi:hypothetical protein